MYGVFGYPVEIISNFIGNLMGRKSTLFEKEINEYIEGKKKFLRRKINEDIKSNKYTFEELQAKKKEHIAYFADGIEVVSFNLYLKHIDGLDQKSKDFNRMLNIYTSISKTIEMVRKDNEL